MARLHGVKTLDMVNGKKTKVLYDGVEYVRVEGEGQLGDIGLRISKPTTFVSLGHFYPIIYDRGLRYIDDDGDLMGVPPGTFSFFRKVSASQPSIEDRVSTNEKDIESLKSDVAALKGEAETEYVRIAKSEAKAGDFVKFDEAPFEYLTAGKFYRIYCVDGCGDPRIHDDEGDDFDTYGFDFEVYRKVSAAEPKPERLKVGDYAKVVGTARNGCCDRGDIVKITEDDDSAVPFKLAFVNGEYAGWEDEKSLVRATDEEVAEAKRKQAEVKECKRWAAIGREVGEYKAGDMVQYLYDGEICEVVAVGEDGSVKVATQNHGNCTENQSSIELIAPVEARFDRKDVE